MQLKKILSRLLICALCIGCFYTSAAPAINNVPNGDVGEYGDWLGGDNIVKFHDQMDNDVDKVEQQYERHVNDSKFVPIEAKIGLAFMYAISSVSDGVLGNPNKNGPSLIKFTIIFLFVMYAFWIALEAWRLIHEGSDYKTVLYEIFKRGFIISFWVLMLTDNNAQKVFMSVLTVILDLSTYFSTMIFDTVAETYNLDVPDICRNIHDYVNSSGIKNDEILLGKDAAANMMCLPGRFSVYFYKAVGLGFKWMVQGFHIGEPTAKIFVGGVCVYVFVKTIFKYAFMTLGVVADLFLRLVMLPFTAIAESMPSTKEQGYLGQTFNGFLKVLNTKKLSDIINTFINAAVYFVSLSIMMSICATLLNEIVSFDSSSSIGEESAMMIVILGGCLILYMTGKIEDFAKQIGGSIDNSLGQKWQGDAKNLWGDVKNVGGKIYKDWLNKDKKS